MTTIFILWALGSIVTVFVIAGLFKATSDRERHWQDLKQRAREAQERDARNRTLPKNGKAPAVIWK